MDITDHLQDPSLQWLRNEIYKVNITNSNMLDSFFIDHNGLYIKIIKKIINIF